MTEIKEVHIKEGRLNPALEAGFRAAGKATFCYWSQKTSCGHTPITGGDGPDYKFCPYCGSEVYREVR